MTFEQRSEDEKEQAIGRSEESIPGRGTASVKAPRAEKIL